MPRWLIAVREMHWMWASVTAEVADADPEEEPGGAQSPRRESQKVVRARCVACRGRDFAAVLFVEGDQVLDALQGHQEALDRKPLRSALARSRRRRASQPHERPTDRRVEPPP